jgi:hypothetical protein
VLWLGQSKQFDYQSRAFGPSGSLRLNNGWLNFQRQVFLFDLLKLLRGETKTAKAWREDLRRAGILIGLSQTASSVPDAFLWNMIALELLLTRQGDVVGEALPSRAEALLGWSTNWKQENFEQRIRHVYEVRCRLVHQGNRNAPTREDLFFTDDLLLCLLANLVVDTRLFESKEALVQFSKRVEAEKLLGVRPSVRPRSLRMLHRTYRPRDYEVY